MSTFNQRAWKYLPDANEQLQEYFTLKITSRAWDPVIVGQLNEWVQTVHDKHAGWWSDDVTGFWQDIGDQYMDQINALTNNNPSILSNYDAVGVVLGSGVEVAAAEEQAAGISGVQNIVQEQIEEFATEQRQRQQKAAKWAPFVFPAFALAGVYVVLKGLK